MEGGLIKQHFNRNKADNDRIIYAWWSLKLWYIQTCILFKLSEASSFRILNKHESGHFLQKVDLYIVP